jgi:DNA-binding CsgD family transcriptional regulator
MEREPDRTFVYSRGSLPAGSASPHLSVDLVGPSLLFRCLLPVIYGFPQVVRLRLCPVPPGTPPPSPPQPLPPLRVPVRTVALLWHEWAATHQPPLGQDALAVLYGTAAPAPDTESSDSVALSLCDPPATVQTGLLAAAAGASFRSPYLPVATASPGEAAAPPRVILSAREREIAALAANLSNEQIAHLLFVSVATVKTHLHRAFAKLGVRWRCQLESALARHLAPESDGADSVPAPSPPETTPVISPDFAEILVQTKEEYLVTALVESH